MTRPLLAMVLRSTTLVLVLFAGAGSRALADAPLPGFTPIPVPTAATLPTPAPIDSNAPIPPTPNPPGGGTPGPDGVPAPLPTIDPKIFNATCLTVPSVQAGFFDTILNKFTEPQLTIVNRSYNFATLIFLMGVGWSIVFFLKDALPKIQQPTDLLQHGSSQLLLYCSFMLLIQFAAGKGIFTDSGPVGTTSGNFFANIAHGLIGDSGPNPIFAKFDPITTPDQAIGVGTCLAWKVFALPVAGVFGYGQHLKNWWDYLPLMGNALSVLPLVILGLASATITAIPFLIIAIQLFFLKLSAVLIAPAGIVFLGLSGWKWFASKMEAYWKFIWGNGVGMFVNVFVVAIIVFIMTSTEKYFFPGLIADPATSFITSISLHITIGLYGAVCIAVALGIPKLTAAFLEGSMGIGMQDGLGAIIGAAAGVIPAAAAMKVAAHTLGRAASALKDAVKGTAATNTIGDASTSARTAGANKIGASNERPTGASDTASRSRSGGSRESAAADRPHAAPERGAGRDARSAPPRNAKRTGRSGATLAGNTAATSAPLSDIGEAFEDEANEQVTHALLNEANTHARERSGAEDISVRASENVNAEQSSAASVKGIGSSKGVRVPPPTTPITQRATESSEPRAADTTHSGASAPSGSSSSRGKPDGANAGSGSQRNPNAYTTPGFIAATSSAGTNAGNANDVPSAARAAQVDEPTAVLLSASGAVLSDEAITPSLNRLAEAASTVAQDRTAPSGRRARTRGGERQQAVKHAARAIAQGADTLGALASDKHLTPQTSQAVSAAAKSLAVASATVAHAGPTSEAAKMIAGAAEAVASIAQHHPAAAGALAMSADALSDAASHVSQASSATPAQPFFTASSSSTPAAASDSSASMAQPPPPPNAPASVSGRQPANAGIRRIVRTAHVAQPHERASSPGAPATDAKVLEQLFEGSFGDLTAAVEGLKPKPNSSFDRWQNRVRFLRNVGQTVDIGHIQHRTTDFGIKH